MRVSLSAAARSRTKCRFGSTCLSSHKGRAPMSAGAHSGAASVGQNVNAAGITLFLQIMAGVRFCLGGTRRRDIVRGWRRGLHLLIDRRSQRCLQEPSILCRRLWRFVAASTLPRPHSQWVQSKQELMVPHADVPDIRWLDWKYLASLGFKACVFDKDNTLTEPYSLQVHPLLTSALAACKEAFNGNLLLFSNSAGLDTSGLLTLVFYGMAAQLRTQVGDHASVGSVHGLEQYDPGFKEAESIERALSVPVLRHSEKKPAGTATEIESTFGIQAHEAIMIGDRYLTDVLYGNRNGMLTVRVAPLTDKGESAGVALSRMIENALIRRYAHLKIHPPRHKLLDARGEALFRLVKDPGVW